MAKDVFEYCVIGSGLGGLSVAKALINTGKSVVILERFGRPAGGLRRIQTPVGPLFPDFAFLPASPASEAVLTWLASLTTLDLQWDPETLPPLTFVKGQHQPFVGFGENAPPYVDALAPYLSENRLNLSHSFSEVTSALAEDCKDHLRLNSGVVGFSLNEGRITDAVLDSGAKIEAQNFIFAGDTRQLLDLLPTDHYGSRDLQRLHKTTSWSLLTLDILHAAPVCESMATQLLMGTTADSQPCLGRFFEPRILDEEPSQASHWMAFWNSELASDEIAAETLREVKRQIRRAYPQALESTLFEKIAVHHNSHSHLALAVDAQSRWPNLPNLWVSKGDLDPHPGPTGTLARAQLVTTALLGGTRSALTAEGPDLTEKTP